MALIYLMFEASHVLKKTTSCKGDLKILKCNYFVYISIFGFGEYKIKLLAKMASTKSVWRVWNRSHSPFWRVWFFPYVKHCYNIYKWTQSIIFSFVFFLLCRNCMYGMESNYMINTLLFYSTEERQNSGMEHYLVVL